MLAPPTCPICCSRHSSSEGAVSAGDRGRRRGAHPPRPVHRAGRNLPQGGWGRRMERDSQVQWPHGLELASCDFYPTPHLSVCSFECATASFIPTLLLLHCKLQLKNNLFQTNPPTTSSGTLMFVCWQSYFNICRWLKFEEDVEDGGERWSKPYVATLSLHSLFELRSCIMNGTVMLDMRANSLEEIAGKLVLCCSVLNIYILLLSFDHV